MKTTDASNKQESGKVDGRQIVEDIIVVYLEYNLFYKQSGVGKINFNALSNQHKIYYINNKNITT